MITFVGAGPGAEDLITVRGQRLLKEADIVIYAGSLVNPGLLKLCKEKCEIYNSAKMTLEEVLEVMVKGHGDGKEIIRLHTGDPCLYGAIREQMDELKKLKIPYEDCPGVSSFCGAAAALEAAKYLEKTFGTPYEIGYPAAGELVPNLDYQGKKILVVHQQVMAEAIRQEILKRENSAEVQTATWFMRKKELACPQDVSLREEDDYIDLVKNGGFDIIFADACMEKMIPDFQGIFVNTRHFAVSGRLCE